MDQAQAWTLATIESPHQVAMTIDFNDSIALLLCLVSVMIISLAISAWRISVAYDRHAKADIQRKDRRYARRSQAKRRRKN